MYHILITDKLGETGLSSLAAAPDVAFDVETSLDKEALLAIIPDYDALIVRSGTRVDADVLAVATRLKVVGRAGVGLDNIDLDAAAEYGVHVVNTPGANSVATAEHTLALMLGLSRHVVRAHASVAAGKWERAHFVGTELYGKTLGIVGFGRVGRLVAERARAFGMEVIAFDPRSADEVAAEYGVELVPLDYLLAHADYISLHAPVTPETKKMINAEAIGRMKDGTVLINVARGALVDEEVLSVALQSGKLAGAAVDVYASEPPGREHPLLGLANVIHTPHLGASTVEAQRNVAVQVVEQVLDCLREQERQQPVDAPPRLHEPLPH